jgi:hypothetical protein
LLLHDSRKASVLKVSLGNKTTTAKGHKNIAEDKADVPTFRHLKQKTSYQKNRVP